jgi:general secretion pathway protein F
MSTASPANAFLYVAVKPGGGRAMGVRQAPTVPALAKTLRTENQLLIKSYRVPGWVARETALSLKDQVALNEQLAQLLSRGVPLVEALDVAAQTVRPQTRPRMVRLRDLVQSGASFADACKAVGGFDSVNIAVYRGAERSGDLAGAARELSTTARRRLAVGSKATTLLIYPAVVTTISLIVAFVMMVVVVPMMAENFARGDIKLPWYSQIVFGLGVWMREHLTLVLVGLAVGLAAALVLRHAVMRGAGWLMRKAPLLKDVVLAQESARFFSVMGAMTKTGVPIADALGVANQAIGHPGMRRQLERLRTRLIEGGLMRQLIDEVTTLNLPTRRLLMAAEKSGDLESAFHTLAADMSEEVDKKSARLLAAMEPTLIVLMAVFIGALVFSMMMPMITMTSRVGG